MPELDCSPDALSEAAACYEFPDQKLENAVIIYLLQQIAGNTSTPKELAELAKCYCFPSDLARGIQIYLLCQVVNAA